MYTLCIVISSLSFISFGIWPKFPNISFFNSLANHFRHCAPDQPTRRMSLNWNWNTVNAHIAHWTLNIAHCTNAFSEIQGIYGNWYFQNDNGQTSFLDGILMDIMVDNDEIWWKFSVSVMVYIYWITAPNHLDSVFNPPLAAKIYLNSTYRSHGLP